VLIEKINDTQMRFILMDDDLAERGINISELYVGSDKAMALFQEIMELVQREGGLEAAQFVMEARWEGDGRVIVMVTKMAEQCEEEDFRFNLCPAARTHARFKRAGLIDPPEDDDPDEESHSGFSFEDMDTAAAAASALHASFAGPSRLYKMNDRFYLWLQNETDDERTTPELEAGLHEFGQKHISSDLSHTYLEEHGEVILAESAVEKLCRYNSF
jgi:negative regulator of genetic competence, sporulation and motility